MWCLLPTETTCELFDVQIYMLTAQRFISASPLFRWKGKIRVSESNIEMHDQRHRNCLPMSLLSLEIWLSTIKLYKSCIILSGKEPCKDWC